MCSIPGIEYLIRYLIEYLIKYLIEYRCIQKLFSSYLLNRYCHLDRSGKVCLSYLFGLINRMGWFAASRQISPYGRDDNFDGAIEFLRIPSNYLELIAALSHYRIVAFVTPLFLNRR